MQVIDYHEAIFASELTTNAKITALAISKYYNWKEDKSCWPSNKTLAKATSLSVRSIVRAKNELVNAGYLVSHRRFNDSNVYKAITPGHSGNYPMTQVLTNNEVNNEKNNEQKDSNESLVLNNNFNQGEVNTSTFDTVWKVFENEEREPRPAAAGFSNRKPGISNSKPGRYNSNNAGQSETDQVLDRATEW